MQAVIFDLDGTLIDSREGIFWQFEELTREFNGEPATRQTIAAAMHGTTEAIIRTLVPNADANFARVSTRHAELWAQSMDFHRLYPGSEDLLAILRRLDIQLGVVTAGDHRTISVLNKAGVLHHFNVVVSSADDVQPKPHPGGVLLALSKLGVKPHEAVMVGDTPADIQAGKNAGLKTVAVTHGFGTHEALRAAAPDHLVNDIPSLLDVLE
ncbi:MAG TPA: HAD family hydrolase [Candidatus Saccharimonadales bacterium]